MNIESCLDNTSLGWDIFDSRSDEYRYPISVLVDVDNPKYIHKTMKGPDYMKPDDITIEEYELFCETMNQNRFGKTKDITEKDVEKGRLTFPEYRNNQKFNSRSWKVKDCDDGCFYYTNSILMGDYKKFQLYHHSNIKDSVSRFMSFIKYNNL